MSAVVGRDRELEAIAAFLDERDEARVLLLEGEPGIGKTTLWRSAIDEARDRGYRVLSCVAARSEARPSYAALRELVADAVTDVASELPPPQLRLIETVVGRGPAQHRPADPGAVSFAFVGLLRALARQAPTLVAVDDVQWLDAASAASLAYALRRLDSGRLPVVLARRAEEAARGAAVASLDGAQVLRVQPLTVGALGRILHTRLGVAYTRPALARLHQASGGNPLFALELARAVDDPARALAPGATIPVPQTLQELVDHRLGGLPAETLEALAFAAALSHPTLDLVGGALGRDAGPLLAPALDGQVVDVEGRAIRFEHPVFAAAVYRRTRRAELHRRLSDVLSDGEERARHLALATDAPDNEIAATLENAAARTRLEGARAVAAELFEAAARLTPADDVSGGASRSLAAAVAWFQAGDTDRARGLLERLVATLPQGGDRVEARSWLGMLLADTACYDDAMRVWQEALTASEDDRASADILRGMSIMTAYSGPTGEALDYATAAVRAAEASGDDECLAYALSARAVVGLFAGDAAYRTFLSRALELEPRLDAAASMWTPTTAAAECARAAVDVDEALMLWPEVLERAAETGDAELEWWATFALARLSFLTGDHARANELAVLAFELSDALGRWRLPAETLRAEIEALDGSREALDALRAVIAEADKLGETRWSWEARASFGGVALGQGDVIAAAEELGTARRLAGKLAMRHPALFSALVDETEAAVAAGRLDQAKESLATAKGLGRRPPWAEPLVMRARAAMLGAGGDLVGAETALGRALELRWISPLQRGRTLLALGVVQRRLGARKAARETLQQAAAGFDELRASSWVEQARTELGRIGGRPPASGELTPGERRIAELVAAGKTNREVAAILVVADRTVESALTRIYRKLDVRSRTELARKLSAVG